jgi:hypothetical protein
MDLLPAKIDQLAHPQGVAEGHRDQQPIANRVAAVAGGLDQALDLGLGELFALAIFGVLAPATLNCRLFRLCGP